MQRTDEELTAEFHKSEPSPEQVESLEFWQTEMQNYFFGAAAALFFPSSNEFIVPKRMVLTGESF